MRDACGIVIIGAGPTGLGAAWRLVHGRATGASTTAPGDDQPWTLVEANDGPGGMARSETIDGFTWDLGGHVLFPHYELFDQLLDDLIDEWHHVTPVRGAWMFNRFIPYPVQRNLRHFPEPLRTEVLHGLASRPPVGATDDFRSLLLAQFGEGLCQSFLFPLNRKMWATEPETMSTSWTGQRSGSKETNVPTVDLDQLRADIADGRDRPAWDDDTRIRYPASGGTGAIWNRLVERLPTERLLFGCRVRQVHSLDHTIELDDGTRLPYKQLISSMPLDLLLAALSDQPRLTELGRQLRPARTTVVGVGLRGHPPAALRDVCSLYLADPSLPFWRLTQLSHYSPHCVPTDTPHWSLLAEVNSTESPTDLDRIVEQCLAGLADVGFIEPAQVATTWCRHVSHGYPVPLQGRDELLTEVRDTLEPLDILPRGRFGGWRYEVSNQDHAFMQGVEVVDRLLAGTPEQTYPLTDSVNELG